ncbi:MAG: hypothetical protein CMJ49_02025 [Planctomycetaceae bacterium]|nr:hypothetical protein [Planctomycetaceae bacterium]
MRIEALEDIQWSFPGGLTGLIAALIACFLIVWISYAFTLVHLRRWARLLLGLCRAAAMILILLCLTRPTLVTETHLDADPRPKVAVVFDESGSMDVEGIHGATRRERALWYWNQTLANQDEHLELDTFAFADEMRTVDQPADAAPPVTDGADEADEPPVRGTALYRNLADWAHRFSSQGYDAVICLTDGVDTSADTRQLALDAVHQTGLRHAFVPMTTELVSKPFVEIAKLESASVGLVGTKVPVNMLIRASELPADEPLSITVRDDDHVIYEQDIKHHGQTLVARAVMFELPISSDRTMTYEAAIHNPVETLASVKWTVQGVREDKPSVLLYQGALDWGTRHLRGVFDRTDNAEMETRFAAGAMPSPSGSAYVEDPFPGPTEIRRFHVVMLMNLSRQQMTAKMESTLRDYVSEGGGLLVINANPASAAALAESRIEQFLPVIFADATSTNRRVPSHMDRYHDITVQKRVQSIRLHSSFARDPVRTGRDALHTLSLTRDGRESPIFGFAVSGGKEITDGLPRYASLAPVLRAKPGATVLARAEVGHLATSDGQPPIALAVQRYGKGRSAVLTTDSLWRWRLQIEADSFAYDQFWRHLVSYLATAIKRRPAWMLESTIHPPDQLVEVRFLLPETAPQSFEDLTFAAVSDDASSVLRMEPTEKPDEYRSAVTTQAGHSWRLVAREGEAVVAEAYITGRATSVDPEFKALKADRRGLAEIAAASGGTLIDPDGRFDYANWLPRYPSEVVQTERKALWHTSWVFGILLGLFLVELLVRRLNRMI